MLQIGVTGFEPATSPTPRVRATRLRYTPIIIRDNLSTLVHTVVPTFCLRALIITYGRASLQYIANPETLVL